MWFKVWLQPMEGEPVAPFQPKEGWYWMDSNTWSFWVYSKHNDYRFPWVVHSKINGQWVAVCADNTGNIGGMVRPSS